MSDFPNNSRKAEGNEYIPPEVEAEIEKVIEGNATIRKPSGLTKLRRSFIAGDATVVSGHVFWNQLVPSLQDVFLDMGMSFLEMMVKGEKSVGFRPHTPVQGPGKINTSTMQYDGMSQQGSRLQLGPSQGPQQPQRYNPNEIVLDSRIEAITVIRRMQETLAIYKVISVGTLYSMLGATPGYMDNRWGWTNLDSATWKRAGGGYLLVLPQPQELN